MTRDEFKALPDDEKVPYQSRRIHSCGATMVRDGHSAGDLHVICVDCEECPDCEDGE